MHSANGIASRYTVQSLTIIAATMPLPDLTATLQALRAGQTSAQAEALKCLDIARSPACQQVFRQLSADRLQTQAAAADPGSPLGGLAFSVKDLFDVQGQVTAAGSVVLEKAPPATRHAPAVARLLAAGGSLIGRTHMVEFAFSGMGINPHFGTPAAWDARSERPAGQGQPLVPGGSSSGAGVSVATGACFIGLGSDTGGSIRIPAALNGIVGFKSTARRVPTTGALPLSTTLDTVCAMTRSVRDAVLTHSILAARPVPKSRRALRDWRLAVPRHWMLQDLSPAVAQAFERALQRLRAAGAQIEEIPLQVLDELNGLNATGGFSAAESFTWHEALLATQGSRYDPRVAARILRGQTMSARDYITLMRERQTWIRRMHQHLDAYDAMLSPTVPITAPTLAEVAPGAERDEIFFRLNTLLLRNPSAVNNLDGCAISLPCHAPGEAPTGLMLWHGAMRDDQILQLALQVEPLLRFEA